ncbi:MAG TPA: polysaccharide biosynthesis/export family protein [Myxococcota bacterium]|nr:polysaccharide biosynthesis/export family protein [Myxococcota bacterium]
MLLSLALGADPAEDDAVARVNSGGFGGVQLPGEPTVDPSYYVGGGDTLHVKVLGEAELTGAFEINPDGSMRYPLLGQVYVSGMSTQQVAGLVTRLLDKDYLVEPEVFVTVKEFGSQPVEVTGLVDKPAVYYLEGPTTLRELIAGAGGVADETITQIEITRGSEEIIVRYEDLVRPGGDVTIVSGDQIHVPQGNAVYVLGQVGEPGAVAWQDGITLTKALTKAGGLLETAKINKVYILRDGDRIEVRYKRILKGKEADFVLEPEDQIFIDVSHV